MEWNEEAVARLKELWTQGLSTAEIGRHLGVTKNAVVGKAHRLGLEGRPSPIRKAGVKKDKPATTASPAVKAEDKPVAKVEKVEKTAKPKAEKVVKEKASPTVASVKKTEEKKQLDMMGAAAPKEVKKKKTKIEFSTPVELPKKRSMSDCCWPIGDPGSKDFHFCGAKAIPGKPYCLEHVQIAYVKLRDRKNNVA